jgi:hypothetical protein
MRAPQQAVRDAERRFPVRIRIAVPPEGLGSRLDQIFAWLDANCGADGWTSAPSSTRGVVNDALAIYFGDVTLASAFVARWCASQKVEIVDGLYRVRDDEPTPRIGAGLPCVPRACHSICGSGMPHRQHPRWAIAGSWDESSTTIP